MKSLHAAGHRITFISPFPLDNQIDNYTMIDSRSKTFVHDNPSAVSDVSKMGTMGILNLATQLGEKCCHDVIQLREIQVGSLISCSTVRDVRPRQSIA